MLGTKDPSKCPPLIMKAIHADHSLGMDGFHTQRWAARGIFCAWHNWKCQYHAEVELFLGYV